MASVRAMVSDRLYAFLIVVGAGLLVLASLVVNTTVTAAATYFEGSLPMPATLLQIMNFIVSFGLTATMFTLVYKSVPDAHVAWGDACVGALVTAFLFTPARWHPGSSPRRHRGDEAPIDQGRSRPGRDPSRPAPACADAR